MDRGGGRQFVLVVVALACVAGAASAADIKIVKNWEQCGGRSCPFAEGCADAEWEQAK
jgi:hypothetical protein